MNFLSSKKLWFFVAILGVLFGGFALYRFLAPESSVVASAAIFNYRQNVKVAEDSALALTFPVAMDSASVEENLVAPEKFSVAEKVWSADKKTLTLAPKEKLPLGTTLAFFVERDAKRADGKILGRDIDYAFEIAGAPKIVTRLPAPDAVGIPSATKLTLTFDRPMIALGDVRDVDLAKFPLTLTPEVAGRWRWLGTTTLEFQPETSFTLATEYSVSVPKGIKSLLGDATREDFSWSFETLRPEVVEYSPTDFGVNPNMPLALTFNQPINLASVKTHLTLARVENDSERALGIRALAYGTKLNDAEKAVTDETKILLTPAEPLALHSTYRVKLTPGVKALAGDLPTAAETNFTFGTAGDLAVTDFRGHDYGLALTFSNPVSDQTLLANFKITPAPEKWNLAEELKKRFEENSDTEQKYDPAKNFTASLDLALPLAPRTKYTVTLDTNLTDEYAQKLGAEKRFEFTTAPVPSKASLYNKKGEFGIFEKTKPPVYYANAVNVSQLNFRLARLTLPQFLALRERKQNDWQATPDLTSENDGFFREFALTPKQTPDAWEALSLDLAQKFNGELTPGIYALALSAPEYFDEETEWNEQLQKEVVVKKTPHVEYQYFALTNLGITLKYSGARTLAWVTNLETGEPVSGAAVQFHTLKNETPISGATDREGFFESAFDPQKFVANGNTWQPEFWVTAEKDGDFAFVASDWNSGIQPWNLGVNSDFRSADARPFRVDSYVYTERPLYAAGDTVYFKGLLRLRDRLGALRLPPNSKKVEVAINDPRGNEVYRATLLFTEFGSFTSSFTLAPEAALGSYYLSANVLPDDDIDSNYLSTNFSVLAYRKPEYTASVKAEKAEYVEGEKLNAEVSGNYYFGASLKDASVTWRLKATDYFFNKYSGDEWYSFGVDEWCFANCERTSEVLASGKGKLSAEGKLALAPTLTFPTRDVSQVATLEVDISDPNNQTISTSTSVVVHKTDVYVGIRTDDYVVNPGASAHVKIITLKPDGTANPSTRVAVKLYARKWNTVKKKSVDGEYYFDNTPTDKFLRETIVTTDSDGKGVADVLIESGGEFRLIAEAADSGGRVARASTSVYAFSGAYVNFPHENDDSIPVLTDKPEYKVGDTAKLLVKSPFQGKGVKALVTVERENILTKQIVDITSNAQPIEIKITEDLLPTAYVSVIVMKPRLGETFDESGVDTGVPAFKIGYATLRVETSSKRLNISIQTDKPKYGPRENVHAKIKTLDANGKPVRAELSFGAVDLSLLALTGFSMPDVVNNFYVERGLGVATAQSLVYLMERFKPGSKGGGGGDLEAKKRGLFRDTAYWNPSVVTNENGEAELDFTLPDNLTTWQLLAIAGTKDHLFGAAKKEIIATKKVLVRSVRPRFAVARDEIQIGALVHNYLDTDAEFSVALTGSGFTLANDAAQKVVIKAGASAKVIFPITVNVVERLTLNLKATTKAGSDELEESLPVYRFGIPLSVATSGVVTNSRSRAPTNDTSVSVREAVLVPSADEASDGKISATLSPTIASYLPGGLEYVTNYPYGCAEQIVSSFLPNVAVKALQNFDAFKIVDDQKLDTNISGGLQKLYQFQRADGGFGYWSESRTSYPYLTAYIAYALAETRDSGYAVDADVLARAYDYLATELRMSSAERLDLATRAYALFVLSEANRADASLANNLYDQRQDLPLFARAYLALTLQKIGANERAQTVLTEILNSARVNPRGVHFAEADPYAYGALMNTDTRTTALVALALIRLDSTHDLLPKVIRYLLAVREDGHWDTTQSTTTTLLTLVEYLNTTGELGGDFTASFAIAGKKFEQKFDAQNILTKKDFTVAFTDLTRDAENPIVITKNGSGWLYYDLLLAYFYTPESLPAREEGFGITREIFALSSSDSKDDPKATFANVAFGGIEGEEIKEAKLNETYRVKLQITVPEERNFVAVESPLPAGMEAVDFNFQTVSEDLRSKINGGDSWGEQFFSIRAWRFNHTEMRDDRVLLFADYLPAGTYEYEYLIRATTPGRFQLRPAHVFEMYFPEIFGSTEGGWWEVK